MTRGRRRTDPSTRSPSADAAVFVISVAAELTGLHPQTLRTYERVGLITPTRTGGGGRRYSANDIDRLQQISELTSAGIGMEGVRRILELQAKLDAVTAHNESLADEVAALRDALRRTAAAGRSGRTAPTGGNAGPPDNKLPVLRGPRPESSMVVWRRR